MQKPRNRAERRIAGQVRHRRQLKPASPRALRVEPLPEQKLAERAIRLARRELDRRDAGQVAAGAA